MKKVLLLNTKRNGYSVSQCGKSITVAELRNFLNNFEDNMPIYFSNDNGYTYGSINSYNFHDEFVEDEEDEDY